MITTTQQQQYLHRLNIQLQGQTPKQLLAELHLAHLMKLPFENLDITFGRPIKLTETDIFAKLIAQQRGGFCFELNYGFYLLLNSLGYDIQILSARIYHDGHYSEEFDHLLLLIELAGEQLIADVGFGDAFNTPLPLDGAILTESHAKHKIDREDDQYILLKHQNTSDWQAQYCFTLTPRKLSDFEHMAEYHQTSPDSIFTQKTTCSIVTDSGRITLANNKLMNTEHGQRSETIIENTTQYKALLRQHFNVTLPDQFQLEEWFSEL